MLAAFGLIVPAIYGIIAAGRSTIQPGIFRVEIAVILFLVYLSSLVFTLVTHKAVVGKAGVKAEKKEAGEPVAEVDDTGGGLEPKQGDRGPGRGRRSRWRS